MVDVVTAMLLLLCEKVNSLTNTGKGHYRTHRQGERTTASLLTVSGPTVPSPIVAFTQVGILTGASFHPACVRGGGGRSFDSL